jgi:predicted dehydrogenase
MPPMKNINIGIVGVGYWGPNYSRVINDLENVNLTWCCDINKVALAKFSKYYPQVKTSDSLTPLLENKTLDAVIIVTPAQNHFDLTKKFLSAGKDVLVEKPLTSNLKDAEILVGLADKEKRILMVDHTFEFNSAIIRLKQLMDNDELGKIYYIYGNYNALGPIRRDVSALWDLPHFVYVVNFLLGKKPVSVSATGKDYLQKGMEDVVFATFEYPEDILFNLNCSWIDPVKVRKLIVVGERKMALFDDMQPEEKLIIYDKGVELNSDPNFANLQLVLRYGDTTIPKLELKEPLKEVISTFIKAVSTRSLIKSDGMDGLNLVKALSAAQESLEKNGKKMLIK